MALADSVFGKALAAEVAKGPHVTRAMTNGGSLFLTFLLALCLCCCAWRLARAMRCTPAYSFPSFCLSFYGLHSSLPPANELPADELLTYPQMPSSP